MKLKYIFFIIIVMLSNNILASKGKIEWIEWEDGLICYYGNKEEDLLLCKDKIFKSNVECYSSEGIFEYCTDVEPLPEIALKRRNREKCQLTERRPSNWPYRAIYYSDGDIFEFDKQGNVLNQNQKNIHIAELYCDDKPLWESSADVKAKVYHIISNSNDLYDDTDSVFFVEANSRICGPELTGKPYLRIEFPYRDDEGREHNIFINNDCDNAIQIVRSNNLF